MSAIQSSSIIRTSMRDLRELDLNDAEFILQLLNEEGFIRFIGDKGVRTLAHARDYILQGPMDSYARNGFGLYAACLRDALPIGICGLVKREGLNDPDVGFAFLSRYWSLGYAVESAAAVLAHAQDVLGLKYERMIRLVDHNPELKLFGRDGSH